MAIIGGIPYFQTNPYDMIAFLMFLCRFAVSVAGKCTRDDSIQLEISRNLSSGCNCSYDEKLVAKYNFSDPFQTLASHHPNHPNHPRAQRSQSRNATEIPHIPGAITFKPWLSSCRSNSSRSKPRGLPPFCGSWIREILHLPLWD